MLRVPSAAWLPAVTVVVSSLQSACSVPHRYYPEDDAGSVGGASSSGSFTTSMATHPGTGGLASVAAQGGSGALPNGGSTAPASIVAGGTLSTGGALPLGGATQGTGGTLSNGGTNVVSSLSQGGGISTAGTAGQIVMGGSIASGGIQATGGSITSGGTPATGGVAATGGTPGCTKDADCTNSDPINCKYTCVNPGPSGVCQPTLLTANTRCATPNCDDKPISGFWDADGKPHIAYAWTEQDGTASIRMQQLKLDGTADGDPVVYKLPAHQSEPDQLVANARGNQIGFLFSNSEPLESASDSLYVQFATSTVAGTKSAPNVLRSTQGDLGVTLRGLESTSSGSWVALASESHASPSIWRAAVGSTIGSLDGLSAKLYDYGFGYAVLSNSLMLAGDNCTAASAGCAPSFVVKQFSLGSLEQVGSSVTLSQISKRPSDPAMGSHNGKAAIIWSDADAGNQVIGAVVNEDGSFAVQPTALPLAVSPLALIQGSGNDTLLVAAAAVYNTTQLVLLRLDASFNPKGVPLGMSVATSTAIENASTRLSPDKSEALVTYRQSGARYRLLSTDVCN